MRRSRLTAAAVLLAVVLAGCTDDPEPKRADPTDSPSPSPTSATTSTPTNTPPPEQEAPLAFIQRFQQASFTMQNSGDSQPYRALTQNCRSCDDLADRVDDVYSSGGKIATKGGSAEEITRVGESDGIQIWEYEVHARPTAILDGAGNVVDKFPGGVDRFQLNLQRVDGKWRVLRINGLADSA